MRRVLLVLFLGAVAAAPAVAADYPTKFVRFIVPYAPGGSSDVLARTIGQKLGEALGQTFVIDNRPGAGSMIGTDVAAKATPDGYTIILSDMPHTINPSIHAKVPYDPVRDFAPITIVGVSPMFLFAHPSFQAHTVKDLSAMAKAQPGKIAIASGGTGATTHLAAELFQSGAGEIPIARVIEVGTRGAHDPQVRWQQAVAVQRAERGEEHALGQVAGRAEQDEALGGEAHLALYLPANDCEARNSRPAILPPPRIAMR